VGFAIGYIKGLEKGSGTDLGRSGGDTHLTGVQAPIHNSGSHLEDAVGALRRPPHLSSGVEQTWGRSGFDPHLTGVQTPLHNSGSHLEDAVGAFR
jgi:hypothetical protein